MTVYAAPAARLLTCLHIPEDGATPGHGLESLTVCGQMMTDEDQWVLTERQPGDRVCQECATNTPAITQEGIF